MFKLKPFVTIAGSMIAHMRAVQRRVTDFNVGSVVRTMLEAPAVEIDALYQAMGQGLLEGIPTAIYRSFDFELEPAKAASGLLKFTARPDHLEPFNIAVGTLVAARGGQVQYRTVEAAYIPVGATTAEVLAVATTPGTAGNAAAGTIRQVISSAVMALGVTNEKAFTNGKGMETEAERKIRFREFVASLARGTVGSIVYIAKQATLTDSTGAVIERVGRVTIEETAGHVRAWVHNGAGNTSAALIQRAQDLVDGYWQDEDTAVTGYRPTGMRTDVRAMSEIPVDVVLLVELPQAARTEANRQRIDAALSATIRATASGSSLKPLDLVNTALTVSPTEGAEIEEPLLMVPCPIGAVLVPGSIEVRWK